MVRAEGAEAFRERIAQAVPLSNFFFERLSRDVDLATPDGKAKLVQLAREPLNKVPTGVFRDLLLQQFAALINMRQETLEQHLFGQSAPPPVAESPQLTLPTGAAAGALLPPLPLAIALLLQYPESAQHITLPEALHTADQPGISTLRALLEQLQANPGLATGAILETWRDAKAAAQLGKLAAWQLITPAEGAKAELAGALQKVVMQIRQERIQTLTAKSNDGGLDAAEKQELLALLKQRH
jgi:DNA primase